MKTTKKRLAILTGITAGVFGIAALAVFVALGGPMRSMFEAAVGTETMGHSQAALNAGIYDVAAPGTYSSAARMADAVEAEFNTEQYDHIAENNFRDVKLHPVSTFSIDVDRASYANVRRYLTQNQLPPPDAVRIEELINYFEYEYPQPENGDPFSVNTELTRSPWNSGNYLVQIGIQGKDLPREELPPSNLVFLLDVSGSMNSADKLPLLKGAFEKLVNQLDEQDRVSIVVYAGASGVVLPPTTGDRKAEILEAIHSLRSGGSTAGAAGIQLAYQLAEKHLLSEGNNRIILATDGDFNVGVSSDGELVRLIEEKRKSGVFLTVLGFGTGNLKDSKMEKLADKGNGNYSYIDSLSEAKKVLVTELGGTLHTIAKDVKIQIEFNPKHVKAYRLIGYENRLLNREDFDDDTKDAGELGSGHTVTALYEVIPAGSGEEVAGASPLKYQTVNVAPGASSNEVLTLALRYKAPDGFISRKITTTVTESDFREEGSMNLRFAAAVAEFGMLLRESKHKGSATFDQAIDLAQSSKGTDEKGYRAEFISLIQQAARLDEHRSPDRG